MRASTPQACTEAAASAWFAAHAAEVDRGALDVRDGLRHLAEHGLLGGGRGSGTPLSESVALVEDVAGECLSSAFALWAHLMVVEYFRRGAATPVLAELAQARLIGSTAMAPALRDVAGLEPVPVQARRDGAGLRLDGPISWASNLFPGAVVVLPVRLPDTTRVVVWLRTTDPGVTVAPSPELLALNATASSSVTLDDVRIPAEQVLSEDLDGFVAEVLPMFLLLQTAFCSGLAARSVTEARGRATGVNATLAEEFAEVATLAELVNRRLHAYAARPGEIAVSHLLRLRLDGAHAALDATRVEAALRGGAGYLAHSATSRRLREAAFLPVQAPTEGLLRWQLSRSG